LLNPHFSSWYFLKNQLEFYTNHFYSFNNSKNNINENIEEIPCEDIRVNETCRQNIKKNNNVNDISKKNQEQLNYTFFDGFQGRNYYCLKNYCSIQNSIKANEMKKRLECTFSPKILGDTLNHSEQNIVVLYRAKGLVNRN